MNEIILEERTIKPGELKIREQIKKASVLLFDHLMNKNSHKDEITLTLENDRGFLEIKINMEINTDGIKRGNNE